MLYMDIKWTGRLTMSPSRANIPYWLQKYLKTDYVSHKSIKFTATYFVSFKTISGVFFQFFFFFQK